MTDKVIHFKPSQTNVGAVTINRRKLTQLVHTDGSPVRAGDLKIGQAFDVDLETGVIKTETKT
jgi:hypothetical protein